MTKANIPATISCLTIIGMFTILYSSAPALADCGYTYENDVANDCPLKDKNGTPIWGQLSNGSWISYEGALESREWDRKDKEMRKRMREEKKERYKNNAGKRAKLKIERAKAIKVIKGILIELRCAELTKNPNKTTKAEWKRCNDFITDMRSRGFKISGW